MGLDIVSYLMGKAAGGGGGGGATILSGASAPSAGQGSNGDLYLKTEAVSELDNSGLGWYAEQGSICKDTNVFCTVGNYRSFNKTTTTAAAIAVAGNGTWRPLLASTDALAVQVYVSKAQATISYTNSYTINGVTWYFNDPQYGWSGDQSVADTNYPKFDETMSVATQEDAEYLLAKLGVTYQNVTGDVVVSAYAKVSGAWQSLVGTHISDINL